MMTREQAVEVAKSWIGTPYRLRGRVKQGGCDCATLILEYFIEIGAVDEAMLPVYKGDWFLHSSDNRYLKSMLQSSTKIAETICRPSIKAGKGDVLLSQHFKKLEVYTHAAIVIDFPRVVHAVTPKVVAVSATQDRLLSFKKICVFSPWGKEEN